MPFPFFLGFIVLNNKEILRVREQVECSKVRIKSNISVEDGKRTKGKNEPSGTKGGQSRQRTNRDGVGDVW